MIDNEEIIDLIENANECEYLDFKLEEYKKYDYHELLKDIMAFANAHNKQKKYIIIGMKKKDGITTFKSLDTVTDDANYQQIINEYIEPSIVFNYIPFEYKENKLAIFVIDSNNYENRLFQIKKDFKRSKDTLFKKGESRIRKGSSTSTLSSYDYKKIYLNDERKSNLIIQCYKNDKVINALEFYNISEMYPNIISNKMQRIKNLINEVQKIKFSQSVQKNINNNNSTLQEETKKTEVSEMINSISKIFADKYIEDVKVDMEKIQLISLFCHKNDYNIVEDFFELNNLKLYEQLTFGNGNMPFYNKYVKGTFEEKEKYNLINQLYEKILEYLYIKSYIEDTDYIKYLKLIISNIGDLKDDNILISLIIPKNCLCEKELLECTNSDSANLFIEFYKNHLEMNDTLEIQAYNRSVLNGVAPTLHKPLLNFELPGYMYESTKESEKQETIDEANNILDDIFCYEYVKHTDYDVIKFELNKLVHNNKSFFPEVIPFKKIPDEIKYEIKSSGLKDVVVGVLKFK